jgi:hypothetical protein
LSKRIVIVWQKMKGRLENLSRGIGTLKINVFLALRGVHCRGGVQIVTVALVATAGAFLGATAGTSAARGEFNVRSHVQRLPRLCCYKGSGMAASKTHFVNNTEDQGYDSHADGITLFPTAFDKAVFCVNAVPVVSNIIGKDWSAKELADKFNDALDLTNSEGRKRGLSEDQINTALNNEAAQQESMVNGNHYQEIVALYRYCPA